MVGSFQRTELVLKSQRHETKKIKGELKQRVLQRLKFKRHNNQKTVNGPHPDPNSNKSTLQYHYETVGKCGYRLDITLHQGITINLVRWKNSIVIIEKMSLSLRCILKYLGAKWYVI